MILIEMMVSMIAIVMAQSWQLYQTWLSLPEKTLSQWPLISLISCFWCLWRNVNDITMFVLLTGALMVFSIVLIIQASTMLKTTGPYHWLFMPRPRACLYKAHRTCCGGTSTCQPFTSGPNPGTQRTSAPGAAWHVAVASGWDVMHEQPDKPACAKLWCSDDGQVIAPHEPEIPTVHHLLSSDDSDVPSGHHLPSPSKLGCYNFPTTPLAILGGTHDFVTTSVTSVGTPQSEAGSDTRALTASEVLPDPLSPNQRACTDREVSTSEVSASAAGRMNKVGNGKSATSTDNDNKKSKKTKKGSKLKSAKSKKSADTTSSNVSHCYSDCVDQGRADANMIRCSICMLWIHISCSGEDKRCMGAWTCKNCRNIPSAITAMQSQLASLETFVKGTRDNNQDLVNEIRLLRTENGNLKQKLASVNQHNSELKKLIETMREQSCAQTPHEPLPMQPSSPQSTATGRDVPGPGVTTQNRYAALAALDDGPTGPTPATTSQHQQPRRAKRPTLKPMTVTIVGSSIVRGVAPLVHGKDCDASRYVYPGRTARQINAQIKHIPSSDVTVLAAGTNNIDSQPLVQCKEELRQIIDNVSRKRRDKIVIMSRIPLRHDKPVLSSKIDEVNDFIVQQVKHRKNWHILTHDLSRTDFKNNGHHFNEIGVAKYAHEIRHILRNINGK